jgi:hypothetical protein
MREFTKLDDTLVLHFLCWLNGYLPELHAIEYPRLTEAWDDYKEYMASRQAPPTSSPSERSPPVQPPLE